MRKLQLIQNNIVINTILVECDAAILDDTAGPGDIFDPENGTFTPPVPA